MRPRFVAALAVAATLGGCRTCGGPPAIPKGPPPEYEEPQAPAWLDAGAPSLPAAAPPAASPPAASPPAAAPDAG